MHGSSAGFWIAGRNARPVLLVICDIRIGIGIIGAIVALVGLELWPVVLYIASTHLVPVHAGALAWSEKKAHPKGRPRQE